MTKVLIYFAFNAIVLGTDKKETNSVPNSKINASNRPIGGVSPVGPPFVCEDSGKTKQKDSDYGKCFAEKWLPLPVDKEQTNVRECCFYFDKFCIFDKLVKKLIEF